MADVIELNLQGSGGGRRWALGVGAVGVAALSVLWFTFAQYVPPSMVGVRQVYLGPNKGVQEDGLHGPGLHLVIPGYERLHMFPRNVQLLDFNDGERQTAAEALGTDYHWAPSIRIQTAEGYQVTVDATVVYRVADPYAVLTKVGPGRLFETQVVQRRADQVLRQVLGSLNAEEFYNDTIRTAKIEAANNALTAELAEWGVQVWGILLREYDYDDRYQSAIEQRKIQDQRVFKNQAESVAASRGAERDRVIAEGQATIEVAREAGRSAVRRIHAEADLYYRKQVADGGLLVALAEAKGTDLENRALQAVGAGNLVGLEMAKTLEGTQVIILSTTGPTGVNPLNLDDLVEGF
jgi:regulator of protease activity HflC (stomatin/prohibitin superfamily)